MAGLSSYRVIAAHELMDRAIGRRLDHPFLANLNDRQRRDMLAYLQSLMADLAREREAEIAKEGYVSSVA